MLRILTRLRASAGPETKLLIGDMLLQHACASDAEYAAFNGSAITFPFVAKDSPLLPNLGVANILGYFTDIMVHLPVGNCYITYARYDNFYLLDDGYVQREGAHRGRVDGAHVVRGMEDCGGSEDAWINMGLHDCHAGVRDVRVGSGKGCEKY